MNESKRPTDPRIAALFDQPRALTVDEEIQRDVIKFKTAELAQLILNVPIAFSALMPSDPEAMTEHAVRLFSKRQNADRAIVHLEDALHRAMTALHA